MSRQCGGDGGTEKKKKTAQRMKIKKDFMNRIILKYTLSSVYSSIRGAGVYSRIRGSGVKDQMTIRIKE